LIIRRERKASSSEMRLRAGGLAVTSSVAGGKGKDKDVDAATTMGAAAAAGADAEAEGNCEVIPRSSQTATSHEDPRAAPSALENG
jgi:hypothetical protein